MMRVSSIFSQMSQLFFRTEFERAVVEHRARGFSWGQFIAMLFCHLGRAQSLREICGGLAASEGKLRHLGLPNAPKRSTLAYANEHRLRPLYRSVFYQLLGRCREVAGAFPFQKQTAHSGRPAHRTLRFDFRLGHSTGARKET